MQSIILSRRDIREYDQMISLYTLEHGKVEALARGVKKILSKNAAYLEPFCFVEAEIIPGKEIARLGSVTPINIFKNIRADLDASLAAGYVMDLVDKNIHGGEADKRMFALIKSWLEWVDASAVILSEAKDLRWPLIAFIAKFLTLLGFDPSAVDEGLGQRKFEILVRGSWQMIGLANASADEITRQQKLLYHFALKHLERKIEDWSVLGI